MLTALLLSVIVPFSPVLVEKLEKQNEQFEQTALARYEKDLMAEYGIKEEIPRLRMRDVFDYSTYRQSNYTGRRTLR